MKEELMKIAKLVDFEIEFERPQYRLTRMKRDDVRIDIWGSGTLGIYRNGTQKFIKGESVEELKEIIVNL